MASLLLANGPSRVVPTSSQLAWQKMRYNAFIHFGPNTFTDREWGDGKEDASVFNPTKLDCRQWARTFREAGMKGVVLTAKHHDGFCLWPSKFSTHTVAQSPFKRDIVKELAEACRAEGLKFGIYVSPWDRNHPAYGTPAYNQVFAETLKELLTGYGPIFEVWFDGANGEGPNGKKQVYDWKLFHSVVRKYQPKAVIFSDAGPDIRWVGNESGIAAETNWNTINRERYQPGTPLYPELAEGHEKGTHWVPTECDVSIRPGWFYHKSQDDQVKSGEQLFDLYLKSVGRGSTLLLNVPPTPEGLIHPNDVKALMDFRRLRDESLGKAVDLKGNPIIDHVELREDLRNGQNIRWFRVEANVAGVWREVVKGTTVGMQRILPIVPTRAMGLRVITSGESASVRAYRTPRGPKSFLKETALEKDRRMAWWREARFGMFIHWGLYAIPAGRWNGKEVGGAGEWLMETARVKPTDWEKLQPQFNPTEFDAKRWVQIAKNAGMKYIVITSKHHEGFALWPSKIGTWNVGHTPFKRNPLRELAAECHRQGLKFGLYHSIMDWHHPDYLPKRAWDDRKLKPDYDRYVKVLKGQLKEILTELGPIDVVWFDGEWEATWTHERGLDLYQTVRDLQPQTIVNNRVDVGRAGMQGMSGAEFAGDYGTPEQEIPPSGLPGVDWESCMTMNDTWGFKTSDENWKSARMLIENLVDCASKGGNYLLNVGPTAKGVIPLASVERLAVVGDWLKQNGEAIYGTHPGPFLRPLPWGRVSRNGAKLFLTVFDNSATSIDLEGLQAKVVRVTPIGEPARRLTVAGTKIELPAAAPDALPRVFVCETEGDLRVVRPRPVLRSGAAFELVANQAEVVGNSARFERETNAIGFWTNPADSVSWPLMIEDRGDRTVEIEFACDPESAGATVTVEIGGNTLSFTVPSTGSWKKFVRTKIGSVSLVTPGETTLTVRVRTPSKMAPFNLKAVRLLP